jgi:hypothetical protein
VALSFFCFIEINGYERTQFRQFFPAWLCLSVSSTINTRVA